MSIHFPALQAGEPMSVARREAKRQAVLNAAVTEIARRGYFGTTVSAIARRAGVADGTIYLYFKGKEAILVAIFERAMRRFSDEARRALSDAGVTAEEKLRRFVSLHLSLLGEDRDIAVIFQVEFRHTVHILELLSRSGMRDYLGLIAQVVEQGKREGVFRSDLDPLFAAKVVFGVLDEMATDWVLSRKNVRLASRAGAVCDLLLGGLRAPAAAG
jgi:TetR/AcrR family fatty acid metabolism transcriptional regulator